MLSKSALNPACWSNLSLLLVSSRPRPLLHKSVCLQHQQGYSSKGCCRNSNCHCSSPQSQLFASTVCVQRFQTAVLFPPVCNFSSTVHVKDKLHVPFTSNSGNTEENETHGQPLHSFGSSHKREQASNRFDVQHNDAEQSTVKSDYQPDLASKHHADVYNHTPSVSLSACMQSQVPEPYGKSPSHMNMPGGVNRREDKYVQGRLSDISGSREFSTSSRQFSTYTVDEHGSPTYNTEALEQMLRDPCPQGIQGEDCDQFKIWLSNCMEYGSPPECERLANEYIAGRKTLAQLFIEYDIEIKQSALKRQKVGRAEHVIMFANNTDGSAPQSQSSSSPSDDAPPSPPGNDDKKLSASKIRLAQLKAAVKDYGPIVVVFHVGISLVSLGFFYTLVASNVDVVSILSYFNITLGSAQSSVKTASTFAAAYAVHKIFAPVRIGITLTCVPLIVRSLRARGILKTPPSRPK